MVILLTETGVDNPRLTYFVREDEGMGLIESTILDNAMVFKTTVEWQDMANYIEQEYDYSCKLVYKKEPL